MNTLVYTSLFPSADEPARGIFNLHRVRALAHYSPVRVVAPVPAWKRARRPVDLMHAPFATLEGVQVSYPTYWTVPRLGQPWHGEAIYRSVRSHIRTVRREFPFDAVLGAFAYPDVVVAARLARDFNCPLLALVMGSDMNELATRPFLRGQIRDALVQADRVIAVSAALKQKVADIGVGLNRILVQRNGVDGTRFSILGRDEARARLRLEPLSKTVLFIGNLVEEKGPDLLIEASVHLRRSGSAMPDVLFIGDGPLRTPLSRRAADHGLGDKVKFLGRRAPDEIPIWLAASDVLCLPSRREGCPNVVLEALACGRPVVASAVGGVPELLSDDTGFMVPSNDPTALADALTAAIYREWDPVTLRACVADLTWDTFGRAVYNALRQAPSRHGIATESPEQIPVAR